jgi:hypothetical protein
MEEIPNYIISKLFLFLSTFAVLVIAVYGYTTAYQNILFRWNVPVSFFGHGSFAPLLYVRFAEPLFWQGDLCMYV